MSTKALHSPTQKLRPYKIAQDIEQVTDLLEVCFARKGDKDSQRYIASMRRASRNESFLRWASMARQSSMPLQGFVWEENGRIIGNVNLVIFRQRRKRIFMIANVAVHPEHRRHGIGRALVFQAMQYARRHGAHQLWLQVREDNAGAISLYEQLGFVTRARRTIWVTAPEYRPHTYAADIQIGPLQWRDWHWQKRWLENNYPDFISWFFPVRWQIFSPWHLPLRLLGGTYLRQWRVQRGSQLQGVLTWLPSERKHDMLWLAAPRQADSSALAALLIHTQKILSNRLELRLDHPARQHTAALRAANFKDLRTLCWMEAKVK